jgi:hypothetical protein
MKNISCQALLRYFSYAKPVLLCVLNSAKGDKGQIYTLRAVVSYSGTALKPQYYSEARVWSKISKAWIIFASHSSKGNHQVIHQ